METTRCFLSDEGFVTDMREGRTYLMEQGDCLDVYRAEGSGFKVVCFFTVPIWRHESWMILSTQLVARVFQKICFTRSSHTYRLSRIPHHWHREPSMCKPRFKRLCLDWRITGDAGRKNASSFLDMWDWAILQVDDE